MTTTTKDYYRVLGVAEDADRDAIRKAYRKLAKQYHPDANQGDEKAAERFKEVGEAYAVLSDEEKRKQYDQMRKFGGLGFGFGGAQGPRPGGARPGAPPEGAAPGGFSFEDLGGLGGLGDLFSSIFDRGQPRADGTARRPGGPSPGEDVELVADVSFETAVLGGQLRVSVPITEDCTNCGGSGAGPGSAVHRCSECSGTGTVSFGQGGFAVTRPCPACMGRGRVAETPCAPCQGTGSVRQTRRIQVRVPPAVENGSRLRVPGQGGRGRQGGPPGDLIIVFRVSPHNFFRREGLDIHCTVPINVAQAALGSRVRVRTIRGKHVVLKIPPGTQGGTRFRVRGQGVTKGNHTGDQFVEVRVRIPDDMSDEERERFREWAEAAGLRY